MLWQGITFTYVCNHWVSYYCWMVLLWALPLRYEHLNVAEYCDAIIAYQAKYFFIISCFNCWVLVCFIVGYIKNAVMVFLAYEISVWQLLLEYHEYMVLCSWLCDFISSITLTCCIQGVFKKRPNFCYKEFIAHFTAF